MPKRWFAPIAGSLAVLALSSILGAQQLLPWNNSGLAQSPNQPQAAPAGPAPKRDLTGIWDAGGAGIGARGYQTAPLTPWGDVLGKTHKSGDGIRQVPIEQNQRSALDDGRSRRVPAQPAVRAPAVPDRADAEVRC